MTALKYKPFQVYKNTNFNFLKSIPNGWDLVKLKRRINSIESGNRDGNFKEYKQGFAFSIGGEHIQWNGTLKLDQERYITSEFFNKLSSGAIKTNDILLVKDGATIGKTAHVQEMAISKMAVNEHVYIIRPDDKTSSRFLYYLICSDLAQTQINLAKQGAAQPGLSTLFVDQTVLPFTNFVDQEKIACYLDAKIEIIDLAMVSLNKQLENLEKRRTSLLTQAVMKGLNPNVPMKDSGIEWIGQIPRHWTTKKVKYLFRLENEPARGNHGKELLSVYTAIGVRPRKSLEQRGNKATSTDGYWIVQKEDLIVNKLLAWMGAIGRSEYDGVTSPAYDILRPLKDTVTEYYHFLFRCGICLPEFKKRSRGIMEMRLRLYFEELGSIEVPCPPTEEQREIADYIRNIDDTQIDLENGLKKQMKMLTEYRTALITAAVTGKIDVRGYTNG